MVDQPRAEVAGQVPDGRGDDGGLLGVDRAGGQGGVEGGSLVEGAGQVGQSLGGVDADP
jgi:hypothetical protein